jgi:tight adherence protein C
VCFAFLENGLTFTALLPLAAFGLIAALAWGLFEFFSPDRSRHEERLDEFRDPSIRQRKEQDRERQAKAGEAMARVLEKATPALAKPLQPKNQKEADKLRQSLAHAGFRSEAAPTVYLGMKLFCLIVGLTTGGGYLLFGPGLTFWGVITATGFAGCMFYLPTFIVLFLASRRKQQIFLGLPNALDLMVVCVEAGLGLDQAMRKVAEEMKKSCRVIAEEFGIANFQLQMGRPRAETLQELGQRSGVDDLRSLASILIQADKFGSSIAHALRVQSDAMRTRRRQMAEEKAAKTAVKLIFPLVIFIFPGIFVVLVGPAAITMIREMLPVMGSAGG